MICPFCSLLCDETQDISSCPLRQSSLKLATERNVRLHETSIELERARLWLRASDPILIAGRVYSVESSRAILRLARQRLAVIDSSESGASMDVAIAMSKVGMNSVSIAEARDLSDVVMVLGDDRLSDLYPLLPGSLCSHRRSPTIILLGQQSQKTISWWEASFENVWSIACEVESIPEAIRSWINISRSQESTENIVPIQQLSEANYTSFLWAASSLRVRQRDFWIERLFEAILEWNQYRRAGSLNLAGLDGVFQQVCSWQTGYPGRVAFTDQGVSYHPSEASWQKWFHDHCENSDALILEVDDSGNPTSFLNALPMQSYMGKRIVISAHEDRLGEQLADRTLWLPGQIAGLEHDADMLRADQLVLTRVRHGYSNIEPRVGHLANAAWLEYLGQ